MMQIIGKLPPNMITKPSSSNDDDDDDDERKEGYLWM